MFRICWDVLPLWFWFLPLPPFDCGWYLGFWMNSTLCFHASAAPTAWLKCLCAPKPTEKKPSRSDCLIGRIFLVFCCSWRIGGSRHPIGLTVPHLFWRGNLALFPPYMHLSEGKVGGEGVLFTPEALNFVLASGGGVI